jgi:DNA helicase-2/ATP-dependent DNA helicase PcrA
MFDKQVHLERVFRDELTRLNLEQAEAVQHIEGPVVVVAGPGTGKTHILAARIGYILMETDTRPQDILCLTYTEAATVAMRDRLAKLIGAAAFKVPIYTFHAFCNRIIQENVELFGGRLAESPANELVRNQLLVELVEQLPAGSLLVTRHANPEFYIRDILGLFERMKKDRWQSDVLIQLALDEIDGLPYDPAMWVGKSNRKSGVRKGDVSPEKMADARTKLRRFIEAVHLFEPYQKQLAKRGYYDFDDMILWVLQAFGQHPALLRRYQEQFLYILVDEFQDTNGAQNALVTSLMDYWDSPNLFVVGDDDQSI